jgi:hypothetical protein
MKYRFHEGQKRALRSRKRFILVSAGWQSGKTVIGPPWLYREMVAKGPGDYLVAAPSHTLMPKKILPEFQRLFQRQLRLGRYVAGDKKIFTFSEQGCLNTFGYVPPDPVQVFFGHAQNPDSLESATYKAAWLDEAGAKDFRYGSWESILGRLSIAQGRVLITSRPYDLGWLKQIIVDPWEAAKRNHPLIDVVHFESIANPMFPREEYERARASMPAWRFNMKYRGLFSKPAGIIYDCFWSSPPDSVHPVSHKVPRFAIPSTWPRWLGLDFGGVHTVGVFLAEELGAHNERTGRLFCYRVYGPAGNATAKQHVAEILKGEPMLPSAVGGSKSEDQWRDEFAAAGLGVSEPPVSDVEVGIDRVYGAISRNELFVFDDLAPLLDELCSYSRVLDDLGEPTRDIDDKSSFHCADALRYVIAYLKSGTTIWPVSPELPREYQSEILKAPEGVFLVHPRDEYENWQRGTGPGAWSTRRID